MHGLAACLAVPCARLVLSSLLVSDLLQCVWESQRQKQMPEYLHVVQFCRYVCIAVAIQKQQQPENLCVPPHIFTPHVGMSASPSPYRSSRCSWVSKNHVFVTHGSS